MPISPAYSLFLGVVFYDGLKLESILQGKKDPLRRCDHGTKSFLLPSLFLLTSKQKKKSVRLNLFAGAQRADCHDEHHLQPQCGRQVLLRGQQSGFNKNDIFQVLHRRLRSRLCQERSVRDQALSPNLLARLDGQSWKHCDILSAGKEITTLHATSASISLSKKCQNQFWTGGFPTPTLAMPKRIFFYLASL